MRPDGLSLETAPRERPRRCRRPVISQPGFCDASPNDEGDRRMVPRPSGRGHRARLAFVLRLADVNINDVSMARFGAQQVRRLVRGRGRLWCCRIHLSTDAMAPLRTAPPSGLCYDRLVVIAQARRLRFMQPGEGARTRESPRQVRGAASRSGPTSCWRSRQSQRLVLDSPRPGHHIRQQGRRDRADGLAIKVATSNWAALPCCRPGDRRGDSPTPTEPRSRHSCGAYRDDLLVWEARRDLRYLDHAARSPSGPSRLEVRPGRPAGRLVILSRAGRAGGVRRRPSRLEVVSRPRTDGDVVRRRRGILPPAGVMGACGIPARNPVRTRTIGPWPEGTAEVGMSSAAYGVRWP